MIGVIDVSDVKHLHPDEPESLVFDFYSIALKRSSNLHVQYGQHPFDFNEGVMSFIAPNQVTAISVKDKHKPISQSGWVIYIHSDFLWNTPLARNIKRYDFWDYSLHEALFLSEREKATILAIVQNVEEETSVNLDKFTKNIVISHLEALLNYADRFYNRQFITREKANHQILERMEELLTAYFDSKDLVSKGLPTVSHLAGSLNISPKYLSSMLKVLTGQSAQQHIHEKLIYKAKEKLSTTQLSVSEIAYELGFEHLQSFSKLFKIKTQQSPLEFRATFN
ncbi:helix-turn-helix domain-containing protein [Mucilaginibacter ginkgonis]|uniref:helix-turn-helix domain-containing protein n=1 Tax=Mucilaginibacter ginkgonis TaxID=2682091 RepID=UPI00293D3013|nr:helix-turn-helix transcriptional regulator [Mucilaginibacter ginkgonis]